MRKFISALCTGIVLASSLTACGSKEEFVKAMLGTESEIRKQDQQIGKPDYKHNCEFLSDCEIVCIKVPKEERNKLLKEYRIANRKHTDFSTVVTGDLASLTSASKVVLADSKEWEAFSLIKVDDEVVAYRDVNDDSALAVFKDGSGNVIKTVNILDNVSVREGLIASGFSVVKYAECEDGTTLITLRNRHCEFKNYIVDKDQKVLAEVVEDDFYTRLIFRDTRNVDIFKSVTFDEEIILEQLEESTLDKVTVLALLYAYFEADLNLNMSVNVSQ